MTTIRDFIIKEEISAYGTSEGANKGWDSRGRGRAKKNFEPPSSVTHKDLKDATKNFPVWKSLKKAGFNEIGSRSASVRTFTAKIKAPASKFDGHQDNFHHRIDVRSDGSWRHTKGPVNTDMAVGRVTGTNLQQLHQHLTSGKYQTSFRNVGTGGGGKWWDTPETR
jgi:hypothetical protein